MTMKLYCFGESGNAYKAALALELSGLDQILRQQVMASINGSVIQVGGAVTAACWLVKQPAGQYDMQDVLTQKEIAR